MAHQKLQIEQLDIQKGAIRLSNGHRYLFSADHVAVASKWKPGMTVWVGEVSYPPNGFEFRNPDAMDEFMVVIWDPS